MLDFLLGNDFLAAVIAFAIVLIPAVIIHEIGHFVAAKAVGITVLEFGIGLPPRAVKLFTWDETEFTLNLIPLGGFVRPLGEDFVGPVTDDEADNQSGNYVSEREELRARGITKTLSVNEAKPVPRIFFFTAGAFANLVSALLIFVVIALLGIPQDVGGQVFMTYVAPGSALDQAGISAEDSIIAIGDETFDDEEAFIQAIASMTGQTLTLTVRDTNNGEVSDVELQVTPEIIAQLETPEAYVRIVDVNEGSPAEAAGLQANDFVVSFDGVDITGEEDPIGKLQALSAESAGQQVNMTVIRSGEPMTFILTPRNDDSSGRIGIRIDDSTGDAQNGFVYLDLRLFELVGQPLPEAVNYGFERTGEILSLIAEFPSRLIQGTTEPGEGRLVSIVGVSQLGGRFVQDSIEQDRPALILEYVAVISIALGITNLLPIPALDGGRILFVLLEIVRGRPIPPEREGVVHLAGLIFVLSLSIIFIINDIVNPLTDVLP